MQVLFLVFIAIAIPGFYLALCGLWAIWLALGRTPVAIRVPVFLIGTVPLGLWAALAGARMNELYAYSALLAGAVLSAAVLERKYFLISLFCCLSGIPLVLFAFDRGAQAEWSTTVTLALCCLAGLIALIRPFGFRLVHLSVDAADIERASGHTVDEWILILDKAGAASWKYADIMIFLRSFGFDYRSQKAITIAYEKTVGNRTLDRALDGASQQIGGPLGWHPQSWVRPLADQRFTIVQMLLWSVAAAFFFGFFQMFGRFEITTDDIAMGFPVILTMAIISLSALQRCLAVRDRGPRFLLLFLIAGPSFVIPYAFGVVPGATPMYMMMVSGMLGYTLWLVPALILVRQRGYRLVRLQTYSQPEFTAVLQR